MNSDRRMKEVVKQGYKRCPVCTLLQENQAIICKRCKYKFKKKSHQGIIFDFGKV